MTRQLKVALVHEFLTQFGGGERILLKFSEMFPDAKIYTLISDKKKIGNIISPERIVTSPLQRFPLSQSRFKWYLPLMDWATEQLALPGDLDLVLSDSSAFAKGVIVPPGVPHLCYLHTPTRYLWSVRDEYVRDAPIPPIVRPFVGPVLERLKRWDYIAAQRPDQYVANSANVAKQMLHYYDRDPLSVVFPFVETEKFTVSDTIDDYFLILGRIEPYKRFDLAIEACVQTGLKLKVVGTGTRLEYLRSRYGDHANIEFLGRVPEAALPGLYQHARALIFPQEEDAGITPLESMAAGRPVIAYGHGGVLESVVPGVTGEFFEEQTIASLVAALEKFDWKRYNSSVIREHATQFDVLHFEQKIRDAIDRTITSTVRH